MDSHHNEQLIDALLGKRQRVRLRVERRHGAAAARRYRRQAAYAFAAQGSETARCHRRPQHRRRGRVSGGERRGCSKTADRLVRRKYLRRVQARADRRSSELSLAPAGRKLLKRYEAARNRKLGEAFAGAGAAELRQTAALLERLTKAIVTHSANGDEICLQCGIYLQKRCLVRDVTRAECSYQQRDTRRRNHNGTGAGVDAPRRAGAAASG